MDLSILLNNLGNEEKIILEKFRDIFKNEPSLQQRNDYFYLRWLIARNFDLSRAEKMLRDSLLWRNKNRIDHIFEEFNPIEVQLKYLPFGVVSHDNSGNPILLWRVGLTDIKGYYESIFPGNDIKFLIRRFETYYTSKVNGEISGSEFQQITVIFDLKEFGLRHVTVKPGIEAMMKLCKIYEANYPEILGQLFVINTPKIFETVYSLVKPLLHEKTLNKINIHSHDPAIWKPALLTKIPAECLPVSYGGTKTDPIDGNPDCSSLVNMGGEIPACYYLINNQTNLILSDAEGLLVTKNKSKELLEIKIGKPNTILKWEFYSDGGDIEFSMTSKRGQNEKVVSPRARVDCHISKIRGQLFCDNTELCRMEFDNSFSYFRSKKIWYKINFEQRDDMPSETL